MSTSGFPQAKVPDCCQSPTKQSAKLTYLCTQLTTKGISDTAGMRLAEKPSEIKMLDIALCDLGEGLRCEARDSGHRELRAHTPQMLIVFQFLKQRLLMKARKHVAFGRTDAGPE